jgi:hypothetical protein
MEEAGLSRRHMLRAAGAVGALAAVGGPTGVFAQAATAGAVHQWDIPSIDFTTGTVRAGGHASAMAVDRSLITLTGTGTFRETPGDPQAVTGGGSWSTSSGGIGGHSGTFKVTGFVSFVPVPGKLPSALTDRIGDRAQAHAGLVTLLISYSDGDEGVLTISCHLDNTPDSVFEGVSASKAFVDFFNAQAPAAGVDGNRTLFHAVG